MMPNHDVATPSPADFALRADEALGPGIERLVVSQLGRAVDLLDGAERDVAIHESRKAVKRVRALLRLVRPVLGPPARDWNRALRDAARRMAPLRDAAVAVATLDLLLADPDALPHGAAALGPLRRRLAERADRLTGGTGPAPTAVVAAKDELAQVRTGILDSGRLADLPHEDQTFAGGLRATYRRGRRRRAETHGDAEDAHHRFHEWRKRVKDLRHQIEALHPMWPALTAAEAAELDRLGELLGLAHDFAVLPDALAAVAAPPDLVATLTAHASGRARALHDRALPIGARLYAERPGAFTRRHVAYFDMWAAAQGRATT